MTDQLVSPGAQEPATSPAEADEPAAGPAPRRGLPGGRVITVATLLVLGVALLEAVVQDRIGLWTDITLLVVAIVSPLITRPGDRSLPAMMPPLAFFLAAVVAGQLLLPGTSATPLRAREGRMLLDVLGENAGWVVAATVLSVSIALIGHLVDRRRARRSAAGRAADQADTTPTSAEASVPTESATTEGPDTAAGVTTAAESVATAPAPAEPTTPTAD